LCQYYAIHTANRMTTTIPMVPMGLSFP